MPFDLPLCQPALTELVANERQAVRSGPWPSFVAAACLALTLVASTASSSASSSVAAPAGAAARMAALDPLPFFHSLADAMLNSKDGAAKSCSLHALYGYVLQRTGRSLDTDEFARFRRWAIEHGLFTPSSPDQVVDLDALSARLPEFFGAGVQSLHFGLPVSSDSWVHQTAAAVDAGRVVLAMTSKQGAGPVYTDADHTVRVIEVVRDSIGQVQAFIIRDPDSYRFWESLKTVSVDELGAALARPKELVETNVAAIGVSAEVAYE